jgi:predicted PurR-regulated permease PerM
VARFFTVPILCIAENDNTMSQKDNIARESIFILVVLISFFWIGYAYVMGTNVSMMILHPVVPILLIPLLLSSRRYDPIRLIATIAIAFICVWLLVKLRNVFMPFFVGFLIAYVVNIAFGGLQNIPLSKKKRLHLPKWAAVLVLLALITGIVTFLVYGIIPQIADQGIAMQEGIVNFYNMVIDYAIKTAVEMKNGQYPFKDRFLVSWQVPIGKYIDDMVANFLDKIPSIVQSASQIIVSILGSLSSGFLGTIGKISSAFFITIVFIYTIQSYRLNVERIKNIIPENYRYMITRYAVEIDKNLRAFLKGQIAIIVIISTISVIAYSIIHVPFALLVGVLAGLCNGIPTVGPIIGGAIAVLACTAGFAAGDYGLTRFLLQIVLTIGVAIGIQLLDGSLITPRIMSRALEIHPLVVMFALLLSASLLGIWGVLLAIPGVMVVKGIIKVSSEIRAEQKQSLFANKE